MNSKILISIIAILLVGVGAAYYFGYDHGYEQAVDVPEAGVLNLETAKPGDKFGVWTVRENNTKPKEVTDFDGETFVGLDGQIFFDGSLEISGSYIINELEGGVILTPDPQYEKYFPVVHEEEKLRIALFEGLGSNVAVENRVTVTITDLAYQEVFCLACDPWQGYYAEVVE